MKKLICVCVLVVALTVPFVASAQDSGEEQEIQGTAVEYIYVEGSLPLVPSANTIASKLALPLHLTPNNVGIVTAQLFREQNGRVLGDALANVSSVNVQPGFGVTDYYVVRGFDSLSSTLVLTDGAPEPEATYWNLYNVDLVEVLKGPGGFLYGSNPLAGTVNLVRKQPFASQRIAGGAAFGSYADVEGNLDYNLGRPDGDVAFRLNALYRRADGYRDDKGNRVGGFNPSVSARLAEGHDLNASFEYNRAEYSPDAGIPLLVTGISVSGDPIYAVAPVDSKSNYNPPSDRSDQNVYRFQVDYEGALNDTVTVRNKLYYRGLDWLSDGTLLLGAAPRFTPQFAISGYDVFRTQIKLDDSQKFIGNQLEAVAELETGDIRHNLLAGVEFGRYSDAYTLDIFQIGPIDLNNPVEFPFDPLVAAPPQLGDARSIVLAPYVIDQIGVSDSFQVLAGARLDSIDFKDDLNNLERQDTELSPMLGAVWLPTPDVSLYGNYSRSFAPPSARAIGDLQPEKSRQFELGVKTRWLDGRAQTTAAVYHLERDNIAIPDDNGFTQQLGNQRSRGFELELAIEPGSGFRAVASYAYNDSELTEFTERIRVPTEMGLFEFTADHSGNRPAFAPENLLSVWGTKSFTNGLGISLGARFVGEQFIAEDNAFAIPSAFVVNGAASYAWSRYSLTLNVQNLTGTDYVARGFGSQSVTPIGPAAAWIRLGAAF